MASCVAENWKGWLVEHGSKLLLFARSWCQSREDAEDLVQETFIRAYRALPQFRGESAFYTWLYRIAVNSAKKALTDMKRDPVISEAALAARADEAQHHLAGGRVGHGNVPRGYVVGIGSPRGA
mgnify:CR=1 FL=1